MTPKEKVPIFTKVPHTLAHLIKYELVKYVEEHPILNKTSHTYVLHKIKVKNI